MRIVEGCVWCHVRSDLRPNFRNFLRWESSEIYRCVIRIILPITILRGEEETSVLVYHAGTERRSPGGTIPLQAPFVKLTEMVSPSSYRFSIFYCWIVVQLFVNPSHAFAASRMKEIYGVPGSGWTTPDWNWGYAQGTGHTCAAICRELYMTRGARESLVNNLLQAESEQSVEEIKLILALEWQRGRWDGTDGGRGGYSEVLSAMAAAKRYEDGPDDECLQRLVEDMATPARFRLLGASEEEVTEMEDCISANTPEEGFRKCSGMVLRAMGFVERGV